MESGGFASTVRVQCASLAEKRLSKTNRGWKQKAIFFTQRFVRQCWCYQPVALESLVTSSLLRRADSSCFLRKFYPSNIQLFMANWKRRCERFVFSKAYNLTERFRASTVQHHWPAQFWLCEGCIPEIRILRSFSDAFLTTKTAKAVSVDAEAKEVLLDLDRVIHIKRETKERNRSHDTTIPQP